MGLSFGPVSTRADVSFAQGVACVTLVLHAAYSRCWDEEQ